MNAQKNSAGLHKRAYKILGKTIRAKLSRRVAELKGSPAFHIRDFRNFDHLIQSPDFNQAYGQEWY